MLYCCAIGTKKTQQRPPTTQLKLQVSTTFGQCREESSLICQKIFPISISKDWQQNGRLGTFSDFRQNLFTLARFRDRSLSEDKIVMLSEIDLNFAHVWLTHVILIFPTHIQYKKYRLLQLSIEILSNSYFKYYRYFHVYLKDKSIEMESQMKRGYSRRAFQWN
jgi:hypothetical protein